MLYNRYPFKKITTVNTVSIQKTTSLIKKGSIQIKSNTKMLTLPSKGGNFLGITLIIILDPRSFVM